MAVYLDENGNEIQGGAPSAPVYLDDQGNALPVSAVRGRDQVSASGNRGRVDTTTWAPQAVTPDTAQARTAQAVAGLLNGGRKPPASVIKADEARQAKAAARAQQSGPTANQVIFPETDQALREGASFPGRLFASGKDFATMVPRFAAGAGAGLGTLAGGGGLDAAGTDFAKTMASPSKASAEVAGFGPRYGLNSQVYAGMAENPLTLPMAFLPGAGSLPGQVGQAMARPMSQGLTAGLASYGLNTGNRLAQGQGLGDAVMGETPSQVLGDVLPIGLAGLTNAAGAVSKYLGPRLQEAGKDLIVKIIKPSHARGGVEAQSLREGLDAGGLPIVAKYFPPTISAPGLAKNWAKALEPAAAKFDPLLAEMDQAGTRVSTGQAMDAAQGHLAGRIAGGWTPVSAADEGVSALDWVRSRLAQSDNPSDVSAVLSGRQQLPPRGPTIATANTQEIQPGFVRPGPVAPVSENQVLDPGFNRPGPMVGNTTTSAPNEGGSFVMVGGVKKWIPGAPSQPLVQGLGTFSQAPGEAVAPRILEQMGGTRPLVQGEAVAPRSIQVASGYKELLPGAQPAKQDVLISPSVAHFRKSALQKEAFKDIAKSTARAEASKGAAADLRQQLIEADQRYADLMAETAPLYKMAPAMERAAARENRNLFSLATLARPWAIPQELPVTARGLYSMGGLFNGLAQDPSMFMRSGLAPASSLGRR